MTLAQVIALLAFLDSAFRLGGKLLEVAVSHTPALLPAVPDTTRNAWNARARALDDSAPIAPADDDTDPA